MIVSYNEFILAQLWNHACILSWDQPVLSNECNVSAQDWVRSVLRPVTSQMR